VVVVVVDGQVGSLGEVLPQQPVGVLVGPSLPWTVGLAEEHRDTRASLEVGVACHLGALIPRE
jgi:hypothetical protein